MPQARDEAGNIWEVDAQGNPVRLLQAANQPPADPAYPYEGPKAAAEARRTQAQAAEAESTTPTTVATNQLPQGYRWADPSNPNAGVVRLPGYEERPSDASVKREEETEGRLQKGSVVKGLMGDVIRLYKDDFRGQPPARLFGLLEKFPFLPKNERFNVAGEAGLPLIRGMIARSAKEGDSNTELEIFRTYIPKASDSDLAIEQKLRSMEILLRGLVDGVPPTQSLARPAETPLVDEALGFDREGNPYTPQDDRPNAMTRPRAVGGDPLQAASFGATTGVDAYPPEMLSEHEALIGRLMMQGGGRIDPDAYAQARAALNQKFDYQGNPEQDRAWATQVNDYLQQGGSTVPTDIMPPERDLSQAEILRNNLVNNPGGAAAVGMADAGSFGGVRALAGDQLSALEAERPVASTIGQIGGAITGTGALGAAGRQTAGRLAPMLLRGGGKAQFGRNLAADATYGGLYGGVTEGDPLTGAALAAGGSTIGQGIGKGLGATIGGARLSGHVEALRNRGVSLTTGQMLGGIPKKFEDALASAPVIGDIVNTRRLEGFRDFNRAAFDEAGAPVAARTGQLGEQGVDDMFGQIGGAYDNATAGARVPLDPQYRQSMAGIQGLADRLPPDAMPAFDKVGQNYIEPVAGSGELTGDIFQNTQRALKMKRGKPPVGAQGFEQEWKDAISGVMGANRELMERGGGQNVVEGLAKADEAYRNTKVLQDAARKAAGGSNTGENFVFTPSQLQRAGLAAQKKYPGPRPFRELADQGQEVLPSTIPDSGTPRRLAALALPSALGGSAAGVGALAGGQEGAATGGLSGLALALLLAAGGTKSGQKAINKVLASRPVTARSIGNALRNKAGLFGSATLPFVLSQQ